MLRDHPCSIVTARNNSRWKVMTWLFSHAFVSHSVHSGGWVDIPCPMSFLGGISGPRSLLGGGYSAYWNAFLFCYLVTCPYRTSLVWFSYHLPTTKCTEASMIRRVMQKNYHLSNKHESGVCLVINSCWDILLQCVCHYRRDHSNMELRRTHAICSQCNYVPFFITARNEVAAR